jgi:hypothetical protein
MATKKCYGCKTVKQLVEFKKNKSKRDGLHDECVVCVKKRNRAYYLKNKQKLNADAKAYREARPEETKAYQKAYKETHKEEAKQYRIDNAAYFKAYNEAYKARKNAWIADRRKNDINFKISYNLRTRFHSFISTKGKHTFGALGMPCDTFLSWIEYQFTEGLTWDNYATDWHLDHVLPVSKFNLENDTDQKVCFNWSNFQPLFKGDNWDKGNQIFLPDFFNCLISAHRFIANENLDSQEYQTLVERLRWLRATISDKVKSSWMKEPDTSPTSVTEMGNPQPSL